MSYKHEGHRPIASHANAMFMARLPEKCHLPIDAPNARNTASERRSRTIGTSQASSSHT